MIDGVRYLLRQCLEHGFYDFPWLWNMVKYGEHGPLKIDELPMKPYEHRIHGAAIYGNMDPMNIPQMLAYITWILWDNIWDNPSH